MTESKVKQVLEKEVTCPLCLDLFKEPKKLPCDHVYCKDCLRGLAVRSLNVTISCPECRILTQLPNNDVNNFPAAFRINRLIEVFRHVQIQEVFTDSIAVSGNCQFHSTQPLIFYCETCKKQLCPDCVLVTQDHARHKYGFFKEVAPKYRKELLSDFSNVKIQEPSISNALEEIEAAENSVASHAGKCQDDIDHAFEEMFSALQTCKQAMKEEAAKHYSSLTGIFERQRNQLEEAQSELRELNTSINTSVQEDDQHFLTKAESIAMQIKSLQEKLQTVPMTVIEPQLLTAQAVGTDVLLRYFKTLCSLHNLANPKMCRVEGTVPELHVDRQDTFTLTLKDSSKEVCVGGENIVEADLMSLEGSSTKGEVEQVSSSRVKVILTPQRRGEHILSVTVNGDHITNSPITVMVSMPPKLLSQPVTTISGLEDPTSLIYSQTKLLATEKGQNRIIEFDSQLCMQEFKKLIGVTKLAQDMDHNLYATTTIDHKLHKLRNDGKSIKTVGQFGKKSAEFNFPNGLRVSKSRELYVCDSENNRLQVFDLDLKFKRLFGRKGTGKGQFDFPSDVDFDSNDCIYVADNGNHRIQVLTPNERHIRTIGSQKHSMLPFKLDPVRILIHKNHAYITDYFNHCVLVMTMTGEIVATFGGESLHEPEGITIDKDDFVYVTSHHSKIFVF